MRGSVNGMGIVEKIDFNPLKGIFSDAEIEAIKQGLKEGLDRYSDYQLLDKVKFKFCIFKEVKEIKQYWGASGFCYDSGDYILFNIPILRKSQTLDELKLFVRYLVTHELAHSMIFSKFGCSRDGNIEEIHAELLALYRGAIIDFDESAGRFQLKTYYFRASNGFKHFEPIENAKIDYEIMNNSNCPSVPDERFFEIAESTRLWDECTSGENQCVVTAPDFKELEDLESGELPDKSYERPSD